VFNLHELPVYALRIIIRRRPAATFLAEKLKALLLV